MLTVKNLNKTYTLGKNNEVHALTNVSMRIEEGEVVAVVGPSGSGKSSLLNILGGLDRHYDGEVIVGDKEIRSFDSNFYRRFVVGTIFQQFYLVPSLTVAENVMLPMVFARKQTKREAERKMYDLLDRVGLADRSKHKPKELSGGQAQRVAIARSLMQDPVILLADEPTGNLDSKTGKDIMNLLLHLNKEQNTTLIIVTHDVELIEQLDNKFMLHDGRIHKPRTIKKSS